MEIVKKAHSPNSRVGGGGILMFMMGYPASGKAQRKLGPENRNKNGQPLGFQARGEKTGLRTLARLRSNDISGGRR